MPNYDYNHHSLSNESNNVALIKPEDENSISIERVNNRHVLSSIHQQKRDFEKKDKSPTCARLLWGALGIVVGLIPVVNAVVLILLRCSGKGEDLTAGILVGSAINAVITIAAGFGVFTHLDKLINTNLDKLINILLIKILLWSSGGVSCLTLIGGLANRLYSGHHEKINSNVEITYSEDGWPKCPDLSHTRYDTLENKQNDIKEFNKKLKQLQLQLDDNKQLDVESKGIVGLKTIVEKHTENIKQLKELKKEYNEKFDQIVKDSDIEVNNNIERIKQWEIELNRHQNNLKSNLNLDIEQQKKDIKEIYDHNYEYKNTTGNEGKLETHPEQYVDHFQNVNQFRERLEDYGEEGKDDTTQAMNPAEQAMNPADIDYYVEKFKDNIGSTPNTNKYDQLSNQANQLKLNEQKKLNSLSWCTIQNLINNELKNKRLAENAIQEAFGEHSENPVLSIATLDQYKKHAFIRNLAADIDGNLTKLKEHKDNIDSKAINENGKALKEENEASILTGIQSDITKFSNRYSDNEKYETQRKLYGYSDHKDLYYLMTKNGKRDFYKTNPQGKKIVTLYDACKEQLQQENCKNRTNKLFLLGHLAFLIQHGCYWAYEGENSIKENDNDKIKDYTVKFSYKDDDGNYILVNYLPDVNELNDYEFDNRHTTFGVKQTVTLLI